MTLLQIPVYIKFYMFCYLFGRSDLDITQVHCGTRNIVHSRLQVNTGIREVNLYSLWEESDKVMYLVFNKYIQVVLILLPCT